LAISKQESSQGKRDKTSLVFAAKNVPGALHDILGIFASRNINLTKLESRPSRSKPWEYVFYVDFEGHPGEEIYQQAIRELEQRAAFVKLLGSYPRAE
jgi:prephenate dehydratase